MKRWLAKIRGKNGSAARASLPAGQRIYAIGDVHGRADLLSKMGGLIDSDLTNAPVSRSTAVFVGDYVDRGPDSRSVIERLSTRNFPVELVTLRGNHEAMLVDVVLNHNSPAVWFENGGLETLTSYGVDVRLLRSRPDELVAGLRSSLPSHHVEFVLASKLTYSCGDYFFCHAGIRPGVPLDLQQEEDLLWIREPFLSTRKVTDHVVVHGHTPVANPDVRAGRINIDTGAYITGRLTCVVLEGSERRFLQT